MRLMYVCRLFSGLAQSLKQKKWEPRGVPTIYRLIEALDQTNDETLFVFTVKDKLVGWQANTIHSFQVEGLRNSVTVIPDNPHISMSSFLKPGYAREFSQYIQLHRLLRKFSPDLVYFDRVNIYPAALTTYRTKVPVVWRLMGVPSAMHESLEDMSLVGRLTRKAYQAPFSMVICSRDGSGGEGWMQKALSIATPRRLLLNGADPFSNRKLSPSLQELVSNNKTKVLFVSRLVENKGCEEFIRGACLVLSRAPEGFCFIIVGAGPLKAQMSQLAKENGFRENFHFIGDQPHANIMSLQNACDIYVSLNQMCNLTNSNLEAMRAGTCMIMPRSPGFRQIDEDTDALVPRECVWRINKYNDIPGLAEALIHLHNNPKERVSRAIKTGQHAAQMIPSWEARIKSEISLLEELASNTSQ